MTGSDPSSGERSSALYPEIEKAVLNAIRLRADDIIQAADAGEPAVAVLIPDLRDLIDEGFYWRLAERRITQMLASTHEINGRASVGLIGLPRARCYRRTRSMT